MHFALATFLMFLLLYVLNIVALNTLEKFIIQFYSVSLFKMLFLFKMATLSLSLRVLMALFCIVLCCAALHCSTLCYGLVVS